MAQGQPSVHVLPLLAALPHKARSRLLVPLPPTIAAKLYVATVHAVVRVGLGLKVADLTMHPAGTGVVPTVLASERTFRDLVRPSGAFALPELLAEERLEPLPADATWLYRLPRCCNVGCPSGLVLTAPDHPSTQEPIVHLCEHGVLIFHACERVFQCLPKVARARGTACDRQSLGGERQAKVGILRKVREGLRDHNGARFLPRARRLRPCGGAAPGSAALDLRGHWPAKQEAAV